MTTPNLGAKQPVAERIRAAPRDERRLFRRVAAWQEDVPDARRSVRETFAEPPRRLVRRTVWDSTKDVGARILVDVVECASASDALAALGDRLEWNELANVAEGPPQLGVARFTHPEGVPPAVFFARANLCVAVVSYARKNADVMTVAIRIDDRLTASPSAAPVAGGRLTSAQRAAGREETSITLSMPFPLGEDAYVQFSTEDGALSIEEDQVVVAGARSGARITAYVFEQGREPIGGSLVIGSP